MKSLENYKKIVLDQPIDRLIILYGELKRIKSDYQEFEVPYPKWVDDELRLLMNEIQAKKLYNKMKNDRVKQLKNSGKKFNHFVSETKTDDMML